MEKAAATAAALATEKAARWGRNPLGDASALTREGQK
jgi:hypothetical protein